MELSGTYWLLDAIRFLLILVLGGIIGSEFFNDYKAIIATQAGLYLVISFFFEYFLTWFGA